jgi:selenide,water dikinase
MICDLPGADDERLLVGAESFDDAGAYLLADDLVLLQTVDVIAPVSDDPETFGRVAAANALSDVYAMGGVPRTALNLAFFPARMPKEMQRGVLRGAGETCARAGAAVAGGHTVTDRELKFGLSVSGTCRPDDLLRNSGARTGDRLVLTKPIGTGLILNGMLVGKTPASLLEESLEQMVALNDVASREAVALGAHAATDITGFGLGGHAAEMARGSGVCLALDFAAVPHFAGVFDLMRKGITTAITDDNLALLRSLLDPSSTASREQLLLLADAQTSGGLLVSMPAAQADEYVKRLRAAGVEHAAVIGQVEAADSASIRVV